MDSKEQYKEALKLHHHFEALVYIEMMRAARKIPILQFGNDDVSFQSYIEAPMKKTIGGKIKEVIGKVPLIHIGINFFKSIDVKDLFWQIHFMLGHELQHAKSTTNKDWVATLMLCRNDACQKLAKDVLGRPSVRLNSEKDYENFFAELAKNGVFINQEILMKAIHYIMNSLEDGRIENIRAKRYPGFRKYRKLFRGREWLEHDLRDDGLPDDVSDLTNKQTVSVLMKEILCLATCSVHVRGFLAKYGTSALYSRVQTLIPHISRAVLSRSCKGCMDEARTIFNMLIDDIIESARTELDASALMQMLEDMLNSLTEAMESEFNASPANEENGDGLPGESVFGTSELETEVDEETFEEMKRQMEEQGEDIDAEDAAVKVICAAKSKEDTEEDGESGSEGAEMPGDAGEALENGADGSSDEMPGKGSSISSGEGQGEEQAAPFEGDFADGARVESISDEESENDSKGHSNHDESHAEDTLSDSELEAMLEKEMEEAMQKVSHDADAAQADIKRAEEVKKAAASMKAVEPAPVDLSGLDQVYDDVKYREDTRKYKPDIVLPYELENKGRSLSNKVEEMIKNKKTPDLRGQKAGSIDATRLHVLIRGDLACHKKRGTYDKPDVAGYILLDNSGSMGEGPGSTRAYACDAAAVIEEGFKDHMPLKIAAFDARSTRNVTHEVIKEFDESGVCNLSFNFKEQGRSGWGNKDGYSIRVATKQLLARQEKDKILIVMSDGLPSNYDRGYDEGVKDVRDAVTEAEKAGIKVIGIYMYHSQDQEDFAIYKKMYDQHIFASMDEIEPALENILKRLFR